MATSELPESVGGCRIIRELGQGGMGVVYLAHSGDLGRDVAVELLKPEAAAEEDVARRYLRGARAAARVDHSGIVRTYSAGYHDGRPYTVMEYVDGSDLGEVLDSRGPMPVAAVLEVAEAVAVALGAALEQAGLIHRDIKPDNILVTREGAVKVADLDLAKVVGEGDPETFGGITAAGVAMGTPYYMSPEQCIDSSTVDHRSDMFSLGATLYQLLTGAHPFEGKTLYTLMRNVVENDPEPLPEAVPGPVRALVAKMLAKKLEDRFQTYDGLVRAIGLARSRIDTDGTMVIPGPVAAAQRRNLRTLPRGGDNVVDPTRPDIAAGSAPTLEMDADVTLPFYRTPEGVPVSPGAGALRYTQDARVVSLPKGAGERLKALVDEGCRLMGQILPAAREILASRLETFPPDLAERLRREDRFFQAAVEAFLPASGLYGKLARFPDMDLDVTEIRRSKRRPPSARDVHIRPGTAVVEGEVRPVRVFSRAVENDDGRAVGRVSLVLLEP